MNALYLIRHSLTPANEQRLYCGWTDVPLSEAGVRHAAEIAVRRLLPPCAACATSGMKRARETLRLLTGADNAESIPELMEMNFGAFEMRSYAQLKENPDYLRWIEDESGDVVCPGGESRNDFNRRVTACADNLILRDISEMLVVCHGGVIANLMQHWFPGEGKNFYQWQPGACGGYAIRIEGGRPSGYTVL